MASCTLRSTVTASPRTRPCACLTGARATELTEQSDSACTAVLDYVMKRLRRKEARVKYKALLVMKSCIERGHVMFRKELVLRAEEVRAELSFTGPADAMEGDAPYRRVREEADKVLNMMYDDSARKEEPRAHKQQSIEGGSNPGPEPAPQWAPPTASTQSMGSDRAGCV